MLKLAWASKAWQDYLYWQSQDKKTLKRINRLIHQDTLLDPFEGIGNLSLQSLHNCATSSLKHEPR
jgi:Txe/YoeB family toxin of Txe-Axe toxin-antitoxin module